MSPIHSDNDDYEQFASRFDPLQEDRKARRARKPRANPRDTKVTLNAPIEDAPTPTDHEDSFTTTYTPGPFEKGWLLDSIRPFYDQALITDVLGMVKGGKEASVYHCAGDPATGHALLAAKVYRPRQMRNLRNDALYREGREYVANEGGAFNEGDMREMRAIRGKTSYGVKLQHNSWLNYEYNTLDLLYKAGAAVPQPFAVSENGILMGYVGDETMAAPPLSQVSLDPDEAATLFDEVVRNIRILLRAGWIHGDLSAFNILYWDGQITLIDFPQVTNAHANRSAQTILARDIQRVCEYFNKQGVACNPKRVFDQVWATYTTAFPLQRAADLSVIAPEPD